MQGKRNLIAGAIAIILGSLGGFALGFTYQTFFVDGTYAPTLVRSLVKAGHTHGLLFALYNLIIGLLVDRLQLGLRAKQTLSWLAVVSLVMPIGLIARGLDGGGMTFAPVAMIGAFSFVGSAVVLLIGAARLKEQ